MFIIRCAFFASFFGARYFSFSGTAIFDCVVQLNGKQMVTKKEDCYILFMYSLSIQKFHLYYVGYPTPHRQPSCLAHSEQSNLSVFFTNISCHIVQPQNAASQYANPISKNHLFYSYFYPSISLSSSLGKRSKKPVKSRVSETKCAVLNLNFAHFHLCNIFNTLHSSIHNQVVSK